MTFLDTWNKSKLGKQEKLYGENAMGNQQRKFLINSSDEGSDDEEWIQQLER